MKYFLPIFFLLASCSASHKLKTSEKKTVDSSVITTRDTAHVSNVETSTSKVQAQDVHIRIDYNQSPRTPAESALDQAKARPVDRKPVKTGNKFVDALQDAVAAAGNAGNLSSIRIDIGSISDSSATSSRKDSGGGKATSITDLSTTDQTTSKKVDRPGMPGWVWLLIIAAVLGLCYRYRSKLAPLQNAIINLFKP
jgi:hypothetical protein